MTTTILAKLTLSQLLQEERKKDSCELSSANVSQRK